ncbi:hypothetical protein B2G74_23985 [Burkholderia sp. A27]|jgi:hypothetical protein|nr:hypothetical protein B2G74_23985 [Burkholderia sp. A27]
MADARKRTRGGEAWRELVKADENGKTEDETGQQDVAARRRVRPDRRVSPAASVRCAPPAYRVSQQGFSPISTDT